MNPESVLVAENESVVVTEQNAVVVLLSETETLVETVLVTEQNAVAVLAATDGAAIVAETESTVLVLTVGEAGPPGPQGAQGAPGQAGDASLIKKTQVAGMVLSGHRAVVFDDDHKMVYADATTLYHAGRVAGITIAAALLDDDIEIVSFGEVQEPSWAWAVHGDVFLGASGLLTQTVPTEGAVQKIGYATATDKLFVDIDVPFYLS